jgi:hypothetical protein
MKTHFLISLLLLLAATLFTGCAHVQPWQRDLLAQKKMQLIPDPLENYLDQHIYMSKEASTGGQGVGGGGCGCN